MPVQMKDVARRAGVSVTTVSHVINETRPVAEATRETVLRVMREMNYYKNASARLLARGRSDAFGLLISDIENPFFPELIKSFEIAAMNQGFDLLLGTTNYDPRQARRAVGRMIESKVRGVAVMTTGLDPAFIDELMAQDIPVVLLDSSRPKRGRGNIRVDYSRGAAEAARHLHSLGHREIAFITGPRNRASAVHYRAALQAALAEAGLPEPLMIEGLNTVESGSEAARVLLARPDFPTVIFCGNDLCAIGAMHALSEAGLRVPADVSIIGSDDVLLARYANPPMTTVRIPRDELGRMAFGALEKMLRSKVRYVGEYVLESSLVVRQSTAAARTSVPAVIGGHAEGCDRVRPS